MNIIPTITSADIAQGGVIEGTRQTSEVLAQLGHHVEVASADDPACPWLRDFPFPIYALGPGKSAYQYASRMTPWVRENAARFDAVIVNGLWQHPGFAVRQALRGTPTPYFVYTHGMLDPWFKRTYPLKHLKKSLYWPWGEYRVTGSVRLGAPEEVQYMSTVRLLLPCSCGAGAHKGAKSE